MFVRPGLACRGRFGHHLRVTDPGTGQALGESEAQQAFLLHLSDALRPLGESSGKPAGCCVSTWRRRE